MRAVVFSAALTLVVIAVSRAEAGTVLWRVEQGGNDHYYEAIDKWPPFTAISWDQAKLEAESRTYMGYQGVLATITSQAESNFVLGLIDGFAWIGGFQADGAAEPDGSWQWITGESWSFANWDVGEPSNFYMGDVGGPPKGTAENALHLRPGGVWNDLPHDAFLPAYVVEYGPVPVSSVPEPVSLGIWSVLSLVGVGMHRWRCLVCRILG